jgi:hypothetical protein
MEGLEGYAELVELAKRESALIAEGRWEGFAEIERSRHRVTASLPVRPTGPARALLEEAQRLVIANAEAIAAAIEGTREELVHLARGRRAMSSYGATGPRPARYVDSRG